MMCADVDNRCASIASSSPGVIRRRKKRKGIRPIVTNVYIYIYTYNLYTRASKTKRKTEWKTIRPIEEEKTWMLTYVLCVCVRVRINFIIIWRATYTPSQQEFREEKNASRTRIMHSLFIIIGQRVDESDECIKNESNKTEKCVENKITNRRLSGVLTQSGHCYRFKLYLSSFNVRSRAITVFCSKETRMFSFA